MPPAHLSSGIAMPSTAGNAFGTPLTRVLLLALVLATGPLQAQVPSSERELLLDFYTDTNGPGWTRDDGWGGPAGTECTWYGITCLNNSVAELVLEDNNLGNDPEDPFAASLPWQVVYLPNLIRLDLSGNGFMFPILDLYGDFPQLVILDLSDNQLSGAIPDTLGDLATLQTLDLSGNQLDGPLPAALGNLGALLFLYLDDNQLEGHLPGHWQQLTQLRGLGLGNNALTGPLPAGWSALTQLEFLYAHDNLLSGPIPPQWGALVQLRSLGFSRNALTGPLPPELGQLAALKDLELSENLIDGSIPETLGDLAQLEYLSLGLNRLQGALPASLGNLSRLRDLSLLNNDIGGPLPASFANLAALETLYLQANAIEGPLPAFLGGLTQLRVLILSDNRLSGPIPPELGQLAALEQLGIGNNALLGRVPPQLLQLTNLTPFPPNVITDAHLFYNGLWTDDPAVLTFLETYFPHGNLVSDWEDTQTVPPSDQSIVALDNDSVRFQWTQAGYVLPPGSYRITGGPSDGLFCDGFDGAPCQGDIPLEGPIDISTPSRLIDSFDIDGLTPGATYRFIVRSVSEPRTGGFFEQQNRITSEPGPVLTVTLPP